MIFGKRIYKGTGMVFANFMLLTVCCILITTNLYTKAQTEKISRGFYSENVLNVNVSSSRDEEQVLAFARNMSGGVLFKTGLSREYDIRGVFCAEKIDLPPLLTGRFLSREESESDLKIAVVGNKCMSDTYKSGGKTWIDILKEPFEVIGVMGTEKKNRFQTMIWIPLQSAIDVSGADGQYKIDGRSAKEIKDNAMDFRRIMEKSADVTVEVAVGMEISGVGERLELGTNRLIRAVYLAILIAFILAGALCISYWIAFQKGKMEVRRLLGETSLGVGIHLIGYLLKSAVVALLSGISICLILYGVGILEGFRTVDVLIACGATLGTAVAIGAIELSWYLWKQ